MTFSPVTFIFCPRGFSKSKNITGNYDLLNCDFLSYQNCDFLSVYLVHQRYLFKLCELFCGHSSSSQEFVTVGINLGTVCSLFYYWTSKLINVLLFPSFPNSHHLRANFPSYKEPRPQIQMSRKSTVLNVYLVLVQMSMCVVILDNHHCL